MPVAGALFLYFFIMKFFLFAAVSILLLACSEPTDRIEKKLETFLQDDLTFNIAEYLHSSGDKSALLDTPYYRIKDFRLFEGAKAEIYSAYAEVDFFMYKDIAIHEKRKYRYDVHTRHWDRYLKKLYFGKDSLP